MRHFVIACIVLLASRSVASADDKPERPQHLESQTDIGGVIGSGPFGHRWLTRTLLNVNDEENSFGAHYGLAWTPRRHFSLDLTAGWDYTSAGPVSGNALVLGIWKHMSFLDKKLRVELEGLHRIGGSGYRYEGYYAVDYSVFGIHALNVGREAAAGFQFGSGYGLLPFRVDIRISFGLTDGMADRTSRFVMSFDFR
ncbi:MAG TPA: hypothetical protein VL283_03210 [Candidatus Baltobacteraceae bacterium]|nr:hypothetical protein [Candidatus Baltobacteraceae bacterium]